MLIVINKDIALIEIGKSESERAAVEFFCEE